MVRRAFSVLSAVAVFGAGGCVERTFTVTSEPTGALVYISSVEVGRTPLTIPFTWYGDYDVVLRREGCETLKTHHKVNPPIYEVPPLDLLAELAPWTCRVHRQAHFVLSKQTQTEDRELIRRAGEMREKTLQGLP